MIPLDLTRLRDSFTPIQTTVERKSAVKNFAQMRSSFLRSPTRFIQSISHVSPSSSGFQIFSSVWIGRGLALMLILLLRGAPGHDSLADFRLLVRRQHLENLASLYTL